MMKKKTNQGQVLLIAVLLFTGITAAFVFGVVGPIVRQAKIVRALENSKKSYFLAEAGIEDVVYRLRNVMEVSGTEILTLDGNIATTITTSDGDNTEVLSSGDVDELIRRVRTDVILGSGASFHYGIHAGIGGLTLANTSSISGNVFANGPVLGTGPTNNIIRGSVVSAGPDGYVENIYATSSVFSSVIEDAIIDGDAYYQSISGSTVGGNLYPGSENLATTSLPITDEDIEEWKASALAGGVISDPCPYVIDSATTLGPKKIECDLELTGNNYTVTLTGNLWVEGNIIVRNSPNMKVDPSFEKKGVVIVADNPTDPNGSGKISLENSATFEGSGEPGSYVLLVSQNRSAENGGSEVAVDVGNTVSGSLLVYARHGEILLRNFVNLKEVTAYKIRLMNSAEVKYETGIANLVFDSGPSGGYELLGWKEVE